MVEQEKQMRLLTIAREETRTLRSIPDETLLPIIKTLLGEISLFQEIAKSDLVSPNALERLKFIWCFSGPAEYHASTKYDAYAKYPWARNMDRTRLNHAALIIKKAGAAAPHFLYNGTPEENHALWSVLADIDTTIPEGNVHILGGTIVKTLDQIQQFYIPSDLTFTPGDRIGIISHAPHLPRILRMINRHRPILEELEVILFPVPAIEQGIEEYTELEVKGTLRYIFDFHQATVEPYPFLLPSI